MAHEFPQQWDFLHTPFGAVGIERDRRHQLRRRVRPGPQWSERTALRWHVQRTCSQVPVQVQSPDAICPNQDALRWTVYALRTGQVCGDAANLPRAVPAGEPDGTAEEGPGSLAAEHSQQGQIGTGYGDPLSRGAGCQGGPCHSRPFQ